MLRLKKQKIVRAVKGFRLPMLEYEEDQLDIADQIVIDPDNTYYMQMESDAMQAYGIFKGNILVIDRSLEAKNGAIVVTYFNGEWYAREYRIERKEIILKGSDEATTIRVKAGETLTVWGVVMVNINSVLPKALRKGKYVNVCTC